MPLMLVVLMIVLTGTKSGGFAQLGDLTFAVTSP